MEETDVERAVDAARAAVEAPAGCEYSWRPVTRLDPGRAPYLLVGLGADGSGWVVAVSLDGVVQGRAADPDGARAWWSSVDGELVWAPGSWSRSPLYPLRRVVRGDAEVLLDHEGRPVPDGPGGPGG